MKDKQNKRILADVDLVIKLICFKLSNSLMKSLLENNQIIEVLESTKYVVRKRVCKVFEKKYDQEIKLELENFSANCNYIEPSDEDLFLAAEIEKISQIKNLSMDTGESILCAIAINRTNKCLTYIVTGDKRAIQSISQIIPFIKKINYLNGKFICLEQIILGLIRNGNLIKIRKNICCAHNLDKTLSICFSCTTSNVPPEIEIINGLNSYIKDLDNKSGNILIRTKLFNKYCVGLNNICY
jgi:hypothetical protein